MTNRARNMEWPFRLSSFSHSSFANAAFVIHHFHAMFELKPLSQEALPAALERATRYRLLNEPAEAESICLDVLRTDPDNQQALRSEEHTSELQSLTNLVCRLLL